MAATLVSGASLFTACVNDVADNPVPPEKTIAIDKANFPDDNFREYLLDQDYGQDGVLTETEIMYIDEIDVYDMEISSLQHRWKYREENWPSALRKYAKKQAAKRSTSSHTPRADSIVAWRSPSTVQVHM